MGRRRKEPRKDSLSECPDRCSGRDSSRQRPLTEGEKGSISESARKAIAASSGIPYKCGYCGCVYIRELSRNVILGNLNGMQGSGWHPR
jgi:hypothetical protein